MGLAIAISVIALLVSGLAALYARRTAEQAKKANDLKLVDLQAGVLSGLVALQGQLSGNGKYATSDELSTFMHDAVIPSGLYLTDQVSKEIEAIHNDLQQSRKILEDECEHGVVESDVESAEKTIAMVAQRIPMIVEKIKSSIRVSRA